MVPFFSPQLRPPTLREQGRDKEMIDGVTINTLISSNRFFIHSHREESRVKESESGESLAETMAMARFKMRIKDDLVSSVFSW